MRHLVPRGSAWDVSENVARELGKWKARTTTNVLIKVFVSECFGTGTTIGLAVMCSDVFFQFSYTFLETLS